MSERPVIVVGAGLAGLSCGVHLHRAGRAVLLLEAGDAVGGRVRTDEVEGFRLDRGFQVFQTAYPEAKRLLDYGRLKLRSFRPGAMIHTGKPSFPGVFGQPFRVMSDPWRDPVTTAVHVFNGVGSFSDKLNFANLRQHVLRQTAEALAAEPNLTTAEYLRLRGFSDEVVDQFIRPWFSGVFFERELETPSRHFTFTFKMFAAGDAALPADGMQAIPRQLAEALPSEAVRLNTEVASVTGDQVTLTSGEVLQGSAVVVATDGPAAGRLVGDQDADGSSITTATRGTVCLAFAAERSPIHFGMLLLNGSGQGIVNNLVVPSMVTRTYAPAGQHLVLVSVLWDEAAGLDDEALVTQVKGELVKWFPAERIDVSTWRHLRTDRIEHALPKLTLDDFEDVAARQPLCVDGVYVCGDHREAASLNGAMKSGRLVAEAILSA